MPDADRLPSMDGTQAVEDDALEAVLAASRALFGMVVRTLAEDLPDVTIAQYRTLTILALRGARRPSDLATELGVSFRR